MRERISLRLPNGEPKPPLFGGHATRTGVGHRVIGRVSCSSADSLNWSGSPVCLCARHRRDPARLRREFRAASRRQRGTAFADAVGRGCIRGKVPARPVRAARAFPYADVLRSHAAYRPAASAARCGWFPPRDRRAELAKLIDCVGVLDSFFQRMTRPVARPARSLRGPISPRKCRRRAPGAAATQAPPAVSNNADRRVTKRTEPLASSLPA